MGKGSLKRYTCTKDRASEASKKKRANYEINSTHFTTDFKGILLAEHKFDTRVSFAFLLAYKGSAHRIPS